MTQRASVIDSVSQPPADMGGMAESDRIPLTSLALEDLRDLVEAMGEPRYRGDQIGRWLYKRSATEIDQMSDLSTKLRRELGGRFRLHALRIARVLDSADGVTRKLLLTGSGGVSVESVLLPRRRGMALCLSSQAGCAMRCPFCATGLGGLRRNLSSGEIVDQFLLARSLASGGDIGSIVFMGMGEAAGRIWRTSNRAVERLVFERALRTGARAG